MGGGPGDGAGEERWEGGDGRVGGWVGGLSSGRVERGLGMGWGFWGGRGERMCWGFAGGGVGDEDYSGEEGKRGWGDRWRGLM